MNDRDELKQVYRELCSLSVAMRGTGAPTMREVERRISNLAIRLNNRHGFGPPGSKEPPRPAGRKTS